MKKIVELIKPYVAKSKVIARISFVLQCRLLGYDWKRILSVML